MNKDFNVKDFVLGYASLSGKEEKDRFLKTKLKKEKYLSYAEKVASAENIIKSSSYAMLKVDGTLTQTDKIEIKSPIRYILFVMTIIDKYTNITVDFNNIVSDFDELNKHGLIEIIFRKIGDKEVAEFNTVVEMVLNDFMTNKYEIRNYISDIFSKFYSILKDGYPLISKLTDKIGNMSDKEAEKLIKEFEKIVK